MAVVHLQATVERVVFSNPENGYAVVRARASGERDLVTVVGRLSEVHPGEVLAMEGSWRDDPRYGRQLEVSTAQVRQPADLNGLLAYLGSDLVPGLGPVLARRLVEHFGERTLAILDENPARVQEVPGIGRARARVLTEAWARQREVRRVMEWLRDQSISTLYAPRIFEVYGERALQVLAANPYRIALEVPGFGFVAADQVGRASGVREDSPVRVQAGVEWCLHRAADDGDCYLPYDELCREASAATKVDRSQVAAAVGQLSAAGRVFVSPPTPIPGPSPGAGEGRVISHLRRGGEGPGERGLGPTPIPDPSPHGGEGGRRSHGAGEGSVASRRMAGGWRLAVYSAPVAPASPEAAVYLAAFERAETGLALRLRELLAVDREVDLRRVSRWMDRYQSVSGVELAPEQREALLMAVHAGLSVLTGGPGTGKTTTMRALYHLLVAMGRSVALAAPTGKAARRMSEVVGAPAVTLHRLLGAGRRAGEFEHGEDNPLPHDVVIVDECSMLDLFLAYGLARAIRPGSQLVLVGDSDQLPSVGPGQVLRDLLVSGAVPVVRLSRVFRQAAASRIVVAAHQMCRGEVPAVPTPDDAGSDLWLVDAPRGAVGDTVVSWAVDTLLRRLRVSPADVQVLSPQTRGEAGIDSLNARLQACLNPAQAGKAERFRGTLPLREGDRVIHTVNNYRLGVFNGEIGSIARIDPVEQVVMVDFGDRAVEYSPSDVVALEHAYALTVHRAQGSEWPAVVVALSSEHSRMLGRNLLYTALTRGKRCVVLVGEREVLAEAVADDSALMRRTGLAQRLARES